MLLRLLTKNRDKRKRVAHIGAGVVILIHAYEKYDSGHNSYILFGIAALIFLTVAILHPTIEKKAPWIDGVFFIIEGILSLVVAYEFFHVGKKALPITYLFLACFQFFMAFKKSKKGIEHHKAM
jgi:DNA integrity scanning protein DisA with diadenylate cyclase activity